MISETYFLDGFQKKTDHQDILAKLAESILPDIDTALQILDEVKKFLVDEPNLLHLSSPCTVIGDIHGQFDDILPIIQENKKYIFLGDYVDRGSKSVELLLFLCVKKIVQKNVYMIKGNHETPGQNEYYGFRHECLEKYDISFWIRANEVFELMSICAIVDEKYFLVHGGISPEVENIYQISFLDRTNYNSFLPFLWSDPMVNNGFKISSRGAGYLFGPDELDKFLETNSLDFLVRSHQLVMEGYKIMGKCIFVWSAPNYLGTAGNIASVMHITKEKPIFELFDVVNISNENFDL